MPTEKVIILNPADIDLRGERAVSYYNYAELLQDIVDSSIVQEPNTAATKDNIKRIYKVLCKARKQSGKAVLRMFANTGVGL
ncbi:hypothetical protein HZB69_02385 [Candidatus Amesbacteria bacterium]|nr:hypothetical protein [Candidatus Amesbacteria bacterium]